jgi:hypothetical protein
MSQTAYQTPTSAIQRPRALRCRKSLILQGNQRRSDAQIQPFKPKVVGSTPTRPIWFNSLFCNILRHRAVPLQRPFFRPCHSWGSPVLRRPAEPGRQADRAQRGRRSARTGNCRPRGRGKAARRSHQRTDRGAQSGGPFRFRRREARCASPRGLRGITPHLQGKGRQWGRQLARAHRGPASSRGAWSSGSRSFEVSRTRICGNRSRIASGRSGS